MIGVYERNEEETDTSESSESDEEGEAKPSKDKLKSVRYSKSDTQTSTTIPGPIEKGRQIPKKDNHQTREPIPGSSGAKKCGPLANEYKKPKKIISPIKCTEKTPTKPKEEMPLSKLAPRVPTPRPPTKDLHKT